LFGALNRASRLGDETSKLRLLRIVNPRIAAFRTDERRNFPEHHDTEFHINGSGEQLCF
jgi:hypothetical protein